VTLWPPKGQRVPEGTREVSKQTPKEMLRPASTAPESSRARTEKVKHALRLRRQSQGSLTASSKPPQAAQLTVKLVTDNPNVVIYWLVD